MRTKARAIKGPVKKRYKKNNKTIAISSLEKSQELPFLTMQYYVFEKKRVDKRKRKLNKELKAALRAIKTIDS